MYVATFQVSGHMGWWVLKSCHSHHPHVHQPESKVPYKCAALLLLHMKLYCDVSLGCNFSSMEKLYSTDIPCQNQ